MTSTDERFLLCQAGGVGSFPRTKREVFSSTRIPFLEFGVKYLNFGAMYLSFGAIYLKFGAIYPSLLKLFNTYILVSYRPKLKLKKKGGLKYCTICPDSVFEKHVLLHNSGSWLIRVRFIHSWAAGTITVFLRRDCFLAGFFLLYGDRQVEVCGDSGDIQSGDIPFL